MSAGPFKPKFLKPSVDNCVSYLDKNEPAVETDVTDFVYNHNHSLEIQIQRQKLPIFNFRSHILYLLEKHQCLVLVGETGCGKSTQIPQYLVEAEWTKDNTRIAVTEPRRVAAVSLASRVAEETGTLLGDRVGYSVRFDDCCSENTQIKYMTDGIMLQEMMSDPLLSSYCVVMLDEAHERNLHTDILMGLLKKVLRKRKTLRLIIASATMNAEEVQHFFNMNTTKNPIKDTAVIMSVEGRAYPVKVHYLQEPIPDYVKGTVETVLKIHEFEEVGDILVFLTGQEEVDKAIELLEEEAKRLPKNKLELSILPMYGSLQYNEQLKVFRPAQKGTRKVVVATNIAETSITIHGIVYVVDCGFVKLRWFSAETHTDRLAVVPVSKASAEQRSGRAGRIRAGKAYRLYTEADWEKLSLCTPPEMQRTNLLSAVLQLKALGIDNVLRFNFPSPPPAKNLLSALELLYALDAVDMKGNLTRPLGITMAEFSMDPLFSKMLIVSGEFGCSEEILTIVSMLQVQNVFVKPASGQLSIKARVQKRNFEAAEGDLLTLLNVYAAYYKSKNQKEFCHRNFLNHKSLKRASDIRNQIKKTMTRYNIQMISSKRNTEQIRKCITASLFPNAAYLHHSGTYKTVRGDVDLHIHPNSVLYSLEQPQWILFSEILFTNRLYMRELTVIQQDWLMELAPHFYQKTTK